MTMLTKARRGALTILNGGPAVAGNETAIDAHGRTVLHLTADWLCEQGLAVRTGAIVEITTLGRQVLMRENAGIA